MLLAILSLGEPHVFRFAARRVIALEAWRNGVGFAVRRVEGTLFEPLVLIDSRWSHLSRDGAVTRVEIARAEAWFDWKSLVRRDEAPWFQRLSVEGLTGKVQVPVQSADEAVPRSRPWWKMRRRDRTALIPARIEARDVDLTFQNHEDYVRLERSAFSASELEPGAIYAGRVTIKQPWMHRAFREVSGTTALQGSKLLVADLVLEPGVEIRSFSAQLAHLVQGQLNMDIQVAAFGGTIRAQARTESRERLTFDASGSFTQIGIAKLASFLGVSEAAGGTINEGKFTFRGAPRHFAEGTASLRFDATNFQWESRQWDSLVVGATLMHSRVQVPTLHLRQGANELVLRGDMALPRAGVRWWENDFTCDITAKIENLTELSALLLPEFKYAAGKGTIDGAIRGQDRQFSGQLIVSGSHLRWRDAPIENLHAAVRLRGNECQVTNFELFNDGDYVRGRGVVNILGETQYWGELRSSIAELARYSAILQPPIVPEPLAGGGVIDWSGEGSGKGHSGAFSARLKMLRTVGASASLLHPLNAELNGHYLKGGLQFTRFALADEDSSFTAHVSVGEKVLTLHDIRLMHGEQLWLEGEALLPLDLWNLWPNLSLASLLNDETVSRVRLTAHDLDLAQASQLTGWNFPIGGIIRGSISTDGPLGALQTSGRVSLTNGRLPWGWSGEILTDANAELVLQGSEIAIESLAARHRLGDFAVAGTIGFANVRDPSLQLTLRSERAVLPIFTTDPTSTRAAVAALDWKLEGPLSAARCSGEARLIDLSVGNVDLGVLWQEAPLAFPPIFTFAAEPWRAWRFDIRAATETPVAISSVSPSPGDGGTASAALQLSGSGASPVLAGTVSLVGVPAAFGLSAPDAETRRATVDEATLVFTEGAPQTPTLDLRARSELLGQEFQAHVVGPLNQHVRFVVCQPPLTAELVRLALAETGAPLPGDSRFSLRVPAALTPGVEVHGWAEIATPPEVAPAVRAESLDHLESAAASPLP